MALLKNILPLAVFLSLCNSLAAETTLRVADRQNTSVRNKHYISNRAPLAPSALIKLPPGAIRPGGWLRKQLQLQAEGFHGHLGEISEFLKKDGAAWLSPSGEGKQGWEEPPYWLKGYLNCALVLDDEAMLAESRIWIEGALASQQADGWFGPDKDRGGAATRLKGREDLWPNMIMLFCLQDFHDATGDARVLQLMTRYFKYLHALPEDKYLIGYWPKMRGGDMLFSIYWLYNRTGEKWLLDLAAKNHRRTARWDSDVIDWHNVNMGQAFAEGATWWMQSQDDADLQSSYRNWEKIRKLYGQVPGGMFGGDENCREGFDDPRQSIETCGIVEKMLSDETLVAITADLLWADRCEDAAYNSLPAALTADMKALRYLTSPNQVVSDTRSHSPGIQNGGPMFHMDPHGHRCCQHNFGHGWPYFAQHLYYATPDNGLAAIFYNASSVTARVGEEGGEITLHQKTNYPFDGTVEFVLRTDRPVDFPLHLRVPGWCENPSVKINGTPLDLQVGPRQFAIISRNWKDGDTVDLTLPMKTKLRAWTGNHASVSVDRGPLSYSLLIGEDLVRSGGTDEWPAWEIRPTTPWNYALVLDESDPASSFTLDTKPWPADNMPWTHEGSPVRLKARGRRIPQWILDKHGLCGVLQDSPVRTTEPVEDIELIPMGAARLRISSIPVAGDGPGAREWSKPRLPKLDFKASASHTFVSDDVNAVADGEVPESSGDHSIPRHTFWPRTGTTEWVEAAFDKPRTIQAVSIYWFDDTGRGQCRVPESFKLFHKDGDRWLPVKDPGGTRIDVRDSLRKDRANRIQTAPVTTSGLRMEIELQAGFSAGILEWNIE